MLLLFLIALRFSSLHLPTNQDESRQSRLIIVSQGPLDLAAKMVHHTQPYLAYFQLKYFWHKIFPPTNDVALRLPSAFYSVLVSLLLLWALLSEQKCLAAGIYLLTTVYSPLDIEVSSSARHYGFVNFCAGLFAFFLYKFFLSEHSKLDVLKNGELKSPYFWGFYLSAFLMLNSHFFNYPLVGIFFLGILFLLRKEPVFFKHLKLMFSVGFASVLINILVILRLLSLGPGVGHGEASGLSVPSEKIGSIFGMVVDLTLQPLKIGEFLHNHNEGLTLILLFVCVLVGIVFSRQRLNGFIYLCGSMLALVATVCISVRESNYSFQSRYFVMYSPVFLIGFSWAMAAFIEKFGNLILQKMPHKFGSFSLDHAKFKAILTSLVFALGSLAIAKTFPEKFEGLVSQPGYLRRVEATEKELKRFKNLRPNDGVKSIVLKLRREKKSALIFELKDPNHLTHWFLYGELLYPNYPKFKFDAYYLGPKASYADYSEEQRIKFNGELLKEHKYDSLFKYKLDFLDTETKLYDYFLVYSNNHNYYYDFDQSIFEKDYRISLDPQGIAMTRKNGNPMTAAEIKIIATKLGLPREDIF